MIMEWKESEVQSMEKIRVGIAGYGTIGTRLADGGAMIRSLSGEELPVVRALRHGSQVPRKED